MPGSVSELAEDGSVYNTAVVYSPAGELVARYRKVFPWRPFESARLGRESVVFDLPGTVDREQEIVLARANATVNRATDGVLTAVVDLVAVTNTWRFGSFGLSRVWSHLRDDDEPIPLPLYGGALTPQPWAQANRRQQATPSP